MNKALFLHTEDMCDDKYTLSWNKISVQLTSDYPWGAFRIISVGRCTHATLQRT